MKQAVLFFTFLFCFSLLAEAEIHYVKAGGTGDGSSWANASGDLNQILLDANPCDEVWVATGTYKPSDCTICTEAEREVTFTAASEVALLGGFPSTGTPDKNDRNWSLYPTILSGDIGVLGDAADNSRRILFSESKITLDGITIAGANADIVSSDGAGLRAKEAILENCIFENNISINNGGAISLIEADGNDRLIKISNCHFFGNTAANGGSIFIPDSIGGEIEILDSRFDENEALVRGGAVHIGSQFWEAEINRCYFANNVAVDGACVSGGNSSEEQLEIYNSLFHNNQATSDGGVFHLDNIAAISYCTFVSNTALSEGNVVYVNENNSGGTYFFLRYNIFYNNNTTLSNFTLHKNDTIVSETFRFNVQRSSTDESDYTVISNSPGYAYSHYDQPNPFVDPDSIFTLLPTVDRIIDEGSPNITDIIGTKDLAGNSRITSRAPDVGALEYVAPDCPISIAYVNASATGNNDGTSWEDAFDDLGEALTSITFCDVSEVWIAEGTYLPSCLTCPDYTSYYFELLNPFVTLYGGFPNAGNPDWEERNWEAHPTILSGNVGNPNDEGDNAWAVVHGEHVKLDGLTISDATSLGVYTDDEIGTYYTNENSMELVNCQIKNNQGHGLSANDRNVLLVNCEVSNNGGIGARALKGTITLDQCTFSNNVDGIATTYSNFESKPINFSNCVFENNGTYNPFSRGIYGNPVTGSSSLFIGNKSEKGGAIWAYDTDLWNCTFINNSAEDRGSAVYSTRSANISNCIFWGNYSTAGAKTIDCINIDKSNIHHILTDESDCESLGSNINCGNGNIFNATDPFVSIDNGDYQIQTNSPAFNSGDNSTITYASFDLNRCPRLQDNIVDIGAYEHHTCLFRFTRQSEIDSFPINNPAMTTLNCDVYIRSGLEDPITNLNGLNQVTNIEGFLWIEKSNSLTSLVGLDNLTGIGGFLHLEENANLDDLNGLGNLASVNLNCEISNNENLSSLDGLESLSGIGEYLKIEENKSLVNIDGLNSLQTIGGYCEILNNSSLISLEGLGNLSGTIGDLNIIDNNILPNLTGLGNISGINGHLNIENNNKLLSLIGLEGLMSIDSHLNIFNNRRLTEINNFENLLAIGTDLTIKQNKELVEINDWHNLQTIGGGFTIYYNSALSEISGFENLTNINGFLDIRYNRNIISITGFSVLSGIGDYFNIISETELISINGLQNLDTIGGYLRIQETGLNSVDCFSGLVSVGDYCSFRSNNNLSSLQGLDSLNFVGGELTIGSSSNLIGINGLNNLITAGGIDISSNYSLTTINGFENLTTVSGSFTIENNSDLANIDGFSNFSFIEGGCLFRGNDNLTSLDGFGNLDSIGSALNIWDNDRLSDLSGLNNLDPLVTTFVYIWNNDSLAVCHEPFVCNYLASGGESEISENAFGCNSDTEVLDQCVELGQIQFPIYFDINQNGIQDNGEPYMSTGSVEVELGNCIVYGNPTNGGVKYLPLGDYTITYDETETPLWGLTSSTASYNFTLNEINNTDTFYFGLYPIEYQSNLNLTIANAQPRCNEFVTTDVVVSNNGTTIADGTLWLDVDPNILNTAFIDLPDTLDGPNRYGWYFTELFPGQTIKKEISLQFPGPPDFPIGDYLTFNTAVYFSDINGPDGFVEYAHAVEVLCSYDPNDKLVQPVFPDNYALSGEDLIYTIRFQNTGNAEAYKVVITDVIDSNLDLSTFQYISSSHEAVLSTFMEGNLVTFEFNDIFLPDSTTNFDESQGYVMYSIRANENINENTNVENTANIFFDYNPPVTTNTTENVMVSTFDFDGDGFELWIDCDDNNPLVNVGPEVPYNGLDDDCDPTTLDDDLDQDGFGIAEDCDDNNALVNIGEEVPYNGLDDDCDPTTLDDDLDQDGFGIDEDCDDNNALVNIGEEVPYNGLDDDCDETTLDDDLDQDGFGIAEDCDDENPLVNVEEEVPYNGLDDDCDETTLDDDLDQDGFGIAEDCDDNNPLVNSDAEEIPNNGIDEDCDGEDLIVSAKEILTIKPQIFPNPTSGSLQITFPEVIQGTYELRDFSGKLMLENKLGEETTVDLSDLPQGVYLLLLKTEEGVWTERVVKM